VIDPDAPLRRRDQDARSAQLTALELDSPEDALRALVAATPAGVDLSWFGRIHNLGEERHGALVKALDLVVLGKDPAVALPRAAVEGIHARVLAALEAFHAATPKALGMELAGLRTQCAGHLPPERFLAVLRPLADAKRLEIAGSTARLPRHVATDNPADAKLWSHVKPVLAKAAFNGITIPELAAESRLPEPAIKDFLHRKAKTGELVRVTPERFYLKETLAAFAAIATDVHKAAAGGKFSAAQVRDRTGIGRGRVIEILECFDRLGLTQRAGDLRSMRRDYVPVLGPANPH
jgi:selenocysteine-specific elongation factor